jgi:hypothetical protein
MSEISCRNALPPGPPAVATFGHVTRFMWLYWFPEVIFFRDCVPATLFAAASARCSEEVHSVSGESLEKIRVVSQDDVRCSDASAASCGCLGSPR